MDKFMNLILANGTSSSLTMAAAPAATIDIIRKHFMAYSKN